ncbi:MAG TPA: NAD-dependent epimerase/dehydratase family protein [Rhodanobacteraceae bacterium]|nr:NAD-dependent epimerase/dehydratase family protein [Rhodanobacteraceae bacterium]
MNAFRDTDATRQTGTVLVCGASSQIGCFLLPELVRAGSRVLALSRSPQPEIAGVTWLQGALPQPPDRSDRATAVCSFAPLEALATWIDSGAAPKLERVVATSSMSAESKQASPIAAEREIARRLREGEAALAQACDRRGIAWTIFRPTLIYGAARDKSLTPLARRAVRWRVFGLPAGSGWRQPVHAGDIATAVLRALDGGANRLILQIGGGERLSAAAMFARVRTSLPVRTLAFRVPRPLVRTGARFMPILRGPLTRLEQDLVADNAELERLLDVHPRGFHPDRGCWGL